MQMINHKVGILVSAIKQPINQRKNKGKVKKMRCSCRQDEKQQDAVRNGTVAAGYCAFRKPIAKSLAKFRIAKFANHIANFANHFAKFATHCQNSQSQLALRNSPCEICRPCHPL